MYAFSMRSHTLTPAHPTHIVPAAPSRPHRYVTSTTTRLQTRTSCSRSSSAATWAGRTRPLTARRTCGTRATPCGRHRARYGFRRALMRPAPSRERRSSPRCGGSSASTSRRSSGSTRRWSRCWAWSCLTLTQTGRSGGRTRRLTTRWAAAPCGLATCWASSTCLSCPATSRGGRRPRRLGRRSRWTGRGPAKRRAAGCMRQALGETLLVSERQAEGARKARESVAGAVAAEATQGRRPPRRRRWRPWSRRRRSSTRQQSRWVDRRPSPLRRSRGPRCRRCACRRS